MATNFLQFLRGAGNVAGALPGGMSDPISAALAVAALKAGQAKPAAVTAPMTSKVPVTAPVQPQPQPTPQAATPNPVADIRPPNVAPQPDLGDTPLTDTAEFGANRQALTDQLASTPVNTQRNGFFDRIGDFLKSDEGRATMMRFAAGAANGGLGGGLTAATGFADNRRQQQLDEADKAADRGIRKQSVDQEGRYQEGSLANSRYATDANVGVAGMEERGRNQRYAAPSGSDVLRARTDVYTHDNPSGNAQLDYNLGTQNIGERRYEHDAVSGDTRYASDSADRRAALGIGSKQLGKREETSMEDIPGTGGFFSGPEQKKVVVTTPIAVGDIQPGALPQPRSEADYQALASGTKFQAPDGTIRVKP